MAHQEIQINKDFTFSFEYFDKTGQLIPSSATITIFDNSGNTKQTGLGTIDANGRITFTFLTANNNTRDINFKASISYIIDSVTYYDNILFDVVEHPINNLVTEKDLFVHVKELRDKQFTRIGKTSSNGTVSTLIDNKLPNDNRDWVGGMGEILLSDGICPFKVTSYDRTTGTITFSPSCEEAVPVQTRYTIRESYQDVINEAFDMVHRMVRRKIGIASSYIDSDVIKNLVIYKALEIISIGKVEISADKWDFRSTKFNELYKNSVDSLFAPYDTNMDGNINDWEDEDRPTTSTISRSDFYGRT